MLSLLLHVISPHAIKTSAIYFSKQVKHIIVFTFQRITCLDSTSRDIRDS